MAENDKPGPPYGTYGTFDKFCEGLKDTAVPDHIDRSMLSTLSGGDQTSLLAGLRFLGLIKGDDDKSTELFHRLIQARKKGKDEWKLSLGEVITSRYEPIIGEVNVETTTKAKIQECFRNGGVTAGQMVDKSIRFYLKVLEESGGTVSPHLKALKGRAARRTTGGAPRRKSKSRRPMPLTPPPGLLAKPDRPPDGFDRLPIPVLGGAHIQYPVGLTTAQCTLLEGAVALLRTSVEVTTKEASE